jgi:hypothetical protein
MAFFPLGTKPIFHAFVRSNPRTQTNTEVLTYDKIRSDLCKSTSFASRQFLEGVELRIVEYLILVWLRNPRIRLSAWDFREANLQSMDKTIRLQNRDGNVNKRSNGQRGTRPYLATSLERPEAQSRRHVLHSLYRRLQDPDVDLLEHVVAFEVRRPRGLDVG